MRKILDFDFDLFEIQEHLGPEEDISIIQNSNGKQRILVNFLPVNKKKICTYDCIYCQYGKTQIKTIEIGNYFNTEKLLGKIEAINKEISFAFISGYGEHLLDINFPLVIDSIYNKTKNIVVLTNGLLINKINIRQSLLKTSVIIPTIVSTEDLIFKTICQPLPEVDIKKFLSELKKFKKEYYGHIYIEIFLVKNINDSEENIDKIYSYLKELSPERIYINTVIRAPSRKCSAVSKNQIRSLKNKFSNICEVRTPWEKYGDKI